MRITENRLYLYATAFFSGMSVMAVEMGASRLLTPYFSSSQVIWTVIIGIIMIAMAIGNVWGGRAADKNPDPGNLYRRILLAAVWIAVIPLVGRYVILGVTYVVVRFISGNYLVCFGACLVLFVFPLMLLGTVTPSLIKYATGNLTDNGKTVGTIEACGTVGSILGTFLPTFITIPNFGTAVTFYIFAAILALLAFLYFLSAGKGAVKGGIAAGVIIALLFVPFDYSFAFWEKDLVYEGESIYNYLRVREDPESVILSTNVLEGVQSIYKKSGGLTGMYYDYALAAPLMIDTGNEEPHLLILGMGTGTYAKQCRSYFPEIVSEGVEIDQKIVDLSRKYFDLPEDIPVEVGDGRAYLRNAGTYDVIMVDAYQDITIPFQMASVEFFTLVRAHLKDGGVMVVNMNMRGTREGNINQYLADTISAVFPEVYTADVAHNTNRELFASCNPEMLAVLARNLEKIGDGELRGMLLRVSEGLTRYEPGSCVMTDDRAPVELLSMRVIDELIRDEVAWYREVYAQYGLRGVLGSL